MPFHLTMLILKLDGEILDKKYSSTFQMSSHNMFSKSLAGLRFHLCPLKKPPQKTTKVTSVYILFQRDAWLKWNSPNVCSETGVTCRMTRKREELIDSQAKPHNPFKVSMLQSPLKTDNTTIYLKKRINFSHLMLATKTELTALESKDTVWKANASFWAVHCPPLSIAWRAQCPRFQGRISILDWSTHMTVFHPRGS